MAEQIVGKAVRLASHTDLVRADDSAVAVSVSVCSATEQAAAAAPSEREDNVAVDAPVRGSTGVCITEEAKDVADGGPNCPVTVVVVADSSGFVGAFSSNEKAKAFAEPYANKGVPFIMYRYHLEKTPGLKNKVFVVPYRGSDAVAFVSNCAEKCRKIHAALNAVGLSYEDDISYWEHPVDVPCAPAVKRLDSFLEGLRLYGRPDEVKAAAEMAEQKEKILFDENKDGPLSRMIRESEKITILDCIVPSGIDGIGIDAHTPLAAQADTSNLVGREAEASAAPKIP